MMQLSLLLIIIFVLLIVIGGPLYQLSYPRYRLILENWALKSNYQLINFYILYPPLLALGIFPLLSRSQRVFYIEVVDKAGNKKIGWARGGNYFFGSARDEIEIKWKDPSNGTDVA
jgi:hypothetical protein